MSDTNYGKRAGDYVSEEDISGQIGRLAQNQARLETTVTTFVEASERRFEYLEGRANRGTDWTTIFGGLGIVASIILFLIVPIQERLDRHSDLLLDRTATIAEAFAAIDSTNERFLQHNEWNRRQSSEIQAIENRTQSNKELHYVDKIATLEKMLTMSQRVARLEAFQDAYYKNREFKSKEQQ